MNADHVCVCVWFTCAFGEHKSIRQKNLTELGRKNEKDANNFMLSHYICGPYSIIRIMGDIFDTEVTSHGNKKDQ